MKPTKEQLQKEMEVAHTRYKDYAKMTPPSRFEDGTATVEAMEAYRSWKRAHAAWRRAK